MLFSETCLMIHANHQVTEVVGTDIGLPYLVVK
jgi:hypothetical protein